jgi:DNA mismatch repair protein MutS2
MSRTAHELLEFSALVEMVSGRATSAPGRRAVLALTFTADRAALEAEFAELAEAIAWLRAGHEAGFGALADPEPWLVRLGLRSPASGEGLAPPGAVLSPAELLDAASLADTAQSLRLLFREVHVRMPRLAARAAALADLGPLAAAIRRAVLPNGEIADEASPQLAKIRAAAGATRNKIQQALRRILRARGEEDTAYVTLRGDRFVIPVRAAERRQLPGVIHGASATGQTVFLEPLEAVELNNRLVQLAEDEAAEIARILAELTARLVERGDDLVRAADTIAQVDALFARARFAREFDCALPEFSTGNELVLEAVRHPVLEASLRRQEKPIVPITLALGGDETVLVISGPNTGGKTVALKTVGLAALAAQAGFPVAAERAIVPLFDCVLADIGDEQSITADLSTFSAHALNLKAMLAAATARSLVLADEIGTGTAPEEGSALAVALLEAFRRRGALVLATTHHDRLKTWASTTPGVVNAAVEFDDVNLRPTYRLLVGVPGMSSGIAIAGRLGLPADVVARARELLAPETREAAELIAWLHRTRDEMDALKQQAARELAALDDERSKLRGEWVERQRRRIAELEEQFARAVKQHEQAMAKLVAEIQDRELRAKIEKQAPRQAARLRAAAKEEADAAVVAQLSESQADLGAAPPAERPPSADELAAGVRVRVRGLPGPAVIRRLDDRHAEVEAGPLRMRVARGDITAIVTEEKPPAAARRGTTAGPRGVRASAPADDAGEAAALREINVIGCTVEEATRRVDKFLDDAALEAVPGVRIIHGHGTGALRRGLAEFLTGHPHVARFAHEAPERGGNAITIVELKS